METIEKKATNQQGLTDLYKKVVSEIVKLESTQEQQIKDDFYNRVKSSLNGKNLIIDNSCK